MESVVIKIEALIKEYKLFEVFDILNLSHNYFNLSDNEFHKASEAMKLDFSLVAKSEIKDCVGDRNPIDGNRPFFNKFYAAYSARIHINQLLLTEQRKPGIIKQNIECDLASCVAWILTDMRRDILTPVKEMGEAWIRPEEVLFGIPELHHRPRRACTWYFDESTDYAQYILTPINENDLHFRITWEVFKWDLVFTLEAIVAA